MFKQLFRILLFTTAAACAAPQNVLLICADDLRVEPLAITPNIDRPAARSRVFTNATISALLPAPAARSSTASTSKPPPPPGTIIHHSPAGRGLYLGSPSLCIAPDGSYLASHDYFGPASGEHQRAKGSLHRSTDQGASWQRVTDFDGFFWQGLFTHRDATYLLGTGKHHGNIVIRRSADSGKTWTAPTIIAEGQWHTAPMPVIEHAGRLWRSIEDAHTSNKWGERYRARMMSAAIDADLVDAGSWTISNALAGDPAWLDGDFSAWLEGNAVAGPDGQILNILRVDTSKTPEQAAIVSVSNDGATARFDPATGFIDFPGAAKKFTIRRDPASPGYWALASIVAERHQGQGRPGGIRNTLALLHSDNLLSWNVRSILLYHPEFSTHGFQYPDWQFDGDDLIAVCRTAWDDGQGGAPNNHDANFLTFHRWKSFRNLSRADDVAMPGFIPAIHETTALTITGSGFQIGKLADGETAFSNRGYKWSDVPRELLNSSFTRLPGGARGIIDVTAKQDTIIKIATATHQEAVDLTGWEPTGASFSYNDRSKSRVHLFKRPLRLGETLRLPAGNWTGPILIFD